MRGQTYKQSRGHIAHLSNNNHNWSNQLSDIKYNKFVIQDLERSKSNPPPPGIRFMLLFRLLPPLKHIPEKISLGPSCTILPPLSSICRFFCCIPRNVSGLNRYKIYMCVPIWQWTWSPPWDQPPCFVHSSLKAFSCAAFSLLFFSSWISTAFPL